MKKRPTVKKSMQTERKRAPTEVWLAVSRSTRSDANGTIGTAPAMRQQISEDTSGRGPVAWHATAQRWRMAHNRYGRIGARTMEQNGGEDGQRRAEQEGAAMLGSSRRARAISGQTQLVHAAARWPFLASRESAGRNWPGGGERRRTESDAVQVSI